VRYRATPVPCKTHLLSTTPASIAPPVAARVVSGPDHNLILPNTAALNLEATRASATTGTLELAALGLDEGFLVLVGAHAEVLDSFAGILGATEDQGVAASGGTQGQLVQGDGLTAGGDDASAGGGGESQSGDVGLGEGQEAVVISDGTDDDDGALLALLDVGDNAGQGDGRAVDLGHEQPAEHNLVEGGVGSAGQEAVQLHQELEVDIVALGGLAVSTLDVVAVEIDTWRE